MITKKVRPEADPRFWIGATCTKVRVRYVATGDPERTLTVVSTGARINITHTGTAPFSMLGYALALARAQQRRGATDAMRAVQEHITRVEGEAQALLRVAEPPALELFRRRVARAEQRANEQRRAGVLLGLRQHAALLTEEEVVNAWRQGVVEGVHGR